ncbi:MAG: hypothetical protein ACPLXC_01205 [Candidatus Pacearchaeota archaeon]
MQKKGQVTLFIIIAIVIVALALLAFFYFRARVTVPSGLQPAESYFQDCINMKVKEAAQIAGLQGGYLKTPDFEAGSEYMPFSNQLNYLGIPIPYWFYVSGNNLAKEQKPSLDEIELQFKDYLSATIQECDFSSLRAQGYTLNFEGEPKVIVDIKASSIETSVSWPLQIENAGQQAKITEHKVSTKSNFGALYNDASKIYDYEQSSLFLENYSVDVIRLYAPVDGIELSCAPKTWKVSEVKQELKSALEANIAALKLKGSNYNLANSQNRYFEVDAGAISSNAYLLYMPNAWPSRVEVWPTEDSLMKAEPIGMQPGLGILGAVGLCYVPYHFVYDVYYPVVVQLNKGEELFQFATIVVIDKNMPRNASIGESGDIVLDICQYKSQPAMIFTYDADSRPLEADVYFKCFNQVCKIGRTAMEGGDAILEASVPKCVNGVIIAKAAGYQDAWVVFTTTEEFIANIFLAPSHELTIEMPNLKQGEYALINFVSSSYSTSVYYPEQTKINLSEGNYNITAYLFKDSLITIGAQSAETCVKIPAGGLAGVFGAMQEQCYDISVPQQSLTNVLFGGGKTSWFVTESDLRGKSKISILADTFTVPKDITELSEVYVSVDVGQVNVQLK